MKLKKEQQMGVPPKSKVMRYSYRIAFVLLVCFVPVFLQEAKAQKYIKLAKNILYKGEVVKKRPHGRGTLSVVTEDMNDTVFTITGTFQGNEITDNKMTSPGISFHSRYDRRKEETLSFSKVIYSIDEKTGLSFELIDPTYSIKLAYSFDKQRQKWKQDVLYYPNKVVDTYNHKATASLPSYTDEEECTMSTIDLSSHILDGIGLIINRGNRKLLFDNGLIVEIDKQNHFQTISPVGTVDGVLYPQRNYIKNFLTAFSIKARDGSSWTATITETGLNSIIHFNDGSKYEGIVRAKNSFDYGVLGVNLLQLGLDKIDVEFIDGRSTKASGEVVIWTNGKGETEEARHRRLSNILQEKWVAMVEKGEISEDDAVIRQKEEKMQIEKEIEKEKERIQIEKEKAEKELLNRTFPRKTFGTSVSDIKVPHRAYDSTLKESKIKTLQALVNNDAAEYFHMENIKTELQKKAFSQSEEYQTSYLPRMQQERKNLFEDEYRATFSLKRSEIKGFEYNMKNGTFEFEMWDTKHAKINKGMSDFHILFDEYLCLSYPRSLIALTCNENNNGDDYYTQIVQTCKVSESDALKVENNIENCEIVWIFKFEKVKDSYIYGKTARIYIADKKTGEIYCDLTPSLKASSTNFKSATTIKDKTPKKVYHANGRMEKCAFCNGRGVITTWKAGHQLHPRCVDCNGRGWRLEHYW